MATILERYPHPQQGYCACLGLLALSRRYSATRLEDACVHVRTTGAMRYRSVKSPNESRELSRELFLPLTLETMLTQQTTHLLHALRLTGMAEALDEQRGRNPGTAATAGRIVRRSRCW